MKIPHVFFIDVRHSSANKYSCWLPTQRITSAQLHQQRLNIWVCPLQGASRSQLSAGTQVLLSSHFSSVMLPLVPEIQTAGSTKVFLEDTAKLV